MPSRTIMDRDSWATASKPPRRACVIHFPSKFSLYLNIGRRTVHRECVRAWERQGLVTVDRSAVPWVLEPVRDGA